MTAILAALPISFGAVDPFVKGISGGTAGGTTVTVTLPSGIDAGDIIIITLAVTAGTSRTFTTPSGYTAIRNISGGTNMRRFGIIYKFADGTEGSSQNISISGSGSPAVVALSVLVGNATAAPQVAASAATGNSSNANPPNNTPSSPAKLWIAVEAHESNTPASAAPTNYLDLTTRNRSATENASIGVAWRALSAASEDPGSFTTPSSQWAAETIAIW